MYKTVREGDASLEYTILPQVDELYVHDVSPVRGSPSVKGHRCDDEEEEEERFWVPLTRVLCYMSIAMVTVIAITCCIVSAYVADPVIRSPCAVSSQTSVSVMNEVSIQKGGLFAGVQRDADVVSSTTTSSKADRMKLTDDRMRASARMSTTSPTTLEEDNFELANTETIPPSSEGEHSTSDFSSTGSTSASTFPSLDVVTAESMDSRASMMEGPTNNIVKILRKLKIMKMPTVTIKLRINDTIPHMYMKAGVASYRKGKITTSVLAQALSLDGLIFKTPEETIKPLRAIWPFGDDPDMPRPTRYRMFGRDLFILFIIFMMVACFVLVCGLRELLTGELQDIEESEVEYDEDET